MAFTRPEGMQRDAIKEVGELKIEKERLEEKVTHMRSTLVERNTEYEKVFDWKERRKKEVETLKKQVKLSEEIREAESVKFGNDLAKERKKVKDERTEKKG